MAENTIDGMFIKIGADLSELNAAMDRIPAQVQQLQDPVARIGNIVSAEFGLKVTEAFMKMGSQILGVATQLDDAFDKIRVSTGATGEKLGNLQDSFRNVFKGVPDDAGLVSQAISEIHQRTGASGPALEGLAKQFLDLHRITGEQLGPSIKSTTRLFGDWSVESSKQTATMDMLFKVSQQTGISFNSLAEKLVYAGAPLRQLGFSMEEAAVMVGKFEKEGVNAELVISGMRTALAKFGKAGMEPMEAFQSLIGAIKNTDVAHGNLIAAQVVGTKRMADFAAAVREGRLDMEALFRSVMESKGTIGGATKDTEDWAEAWGRLKNRLIEAAEPIAKTLFDALTRLVIAMEPAIKWIEEIGKAFAKLDPLMQNIILGMLAMVPTVTLLLSGVTAINAVWSVVSAGAATLAALLPSATGLLLGLGSAALIAGAAFVGWKLGSWAYENVPLVKALGDAIADIILKIQPFAKLLGIDLSDGMKQMESGTKKLEETLKAHGITVDRAGLSAEQYTLKLNQAVRALPDFGKNIDASNTGLDKHSTKLKGGATDWTGLAESAEKSAKKAQEAAEKLAKSIDKEWSAIEKMLSHLPKGILEMEAALSKGFNVDNSVKALNDEILKLNQQIRKSGDDSEIAIKKGMIVHLVMAKDAINQLKFAADAMKLETMFEATTKKVDELGGGMKRFAEQHKDLIQTVTDIGMSAWTASKKLIDELQGAVKDLGIKWSGDYANALGKAQDAYDKLYKAHLTGETGIANAHVTFRDMQNAKLVLLQKEIDLGVATGRNVQDLRAEYDSLKISIGGLDGAMKSLGVTTSAELQQRAANAAQQLDIAARAFQNHTISANDYLRAQASYLEAQIAANKASGQAWGDLQLELDMTTDKLKALVREGGKVRDLGLQIRDTVTTAFAALTTTVGNLGKNLANAAFMGKSFGDMVEGFEKAFSELGKSFITTLKEAGKDIFADIVTSLISPITDAVDTVLKSIMESVISPLTEAIGSALERVTTRLTDWITGAITRSLGGIFGGGASAAGGIITATGDWDSVAGEAAGGAKGVAGAATGAIGSAVSAGIGGITNVITGAVSAISGIVGNFQMAGMNASLGLIEESTRYTKVQLVDVIQPQINQYWPYLKNTAELFKLGRIEDSIVYAKDAQWMFLEPIRDELVSLKNLSFPSLEAHVDGSRDQLTYIYDLLDQRLAVPATAGGIAAGSADQFDPGTGGGIGSLTLNVYAQTNNPDELAGVVLENILAYLPTA